MSTEPNDDFAPDPTDGLPGPVQVVLDEPASRYEGRIDGQLVGVVDFTRRGETVHVTHTGTEPAWRGKGVAAAITRSVLDDIRGAGGRLRPECPYTAHFVAEHPEYRDLLA